ncbi:unnamed protein product [Arctogadus glacialis]
MDARFNKCASKEPKPPAQKRTMLPALTKTQQRPVRCAGGLEPIRRKDPLPPLVLKPEALNKAPLQKGKDLQQREQEKMRRWDGQRLAAADALSAFRKHLTPFERKEIKQYQDVWYFGIAAEKVRETRALNHGYDDIEGHYKMVINDHIAYRYEVLEEIGQGSFGRVFKCRDHKTKQLVAMKVIANKKRVAVEAMAEVEILELLQKNDEDGLANVVHMKEYFQFRDHLCITFDLMGKTLLEVLKQRECRGLGTSRVRSHAISLVQSLQFLSRTGIIHCDLKPENILVSEGDPAVIKVADFGSSLREHHNTLPIAQTMAYMSPEAILTKVFTKAVDMWSLGCILAELKTGQILFNVLNKYELVLEMTKVMNA